MTPSWLVAATLLVILFHGISAHEYLYEPEREARSVASGDSDSTVISPDESLSEALRALQSNSSLVLSTGQYQLEEYVLVSDLSNVCISGQGDVVISCNENVGLAFFNITGLVIDGVRIERCGLSGPNLDHALTEIRQLIDLFVVIYSHMRFALLLGHCENVQLNTIELYNNVGFGLVGINIIGASVISQLNAVNNTQLSNCVRDPTESYVEIEDPDRHGGAAVFVYQEYLPEYQELYKDRYYELTIEKALFIQNTECSSNYLSYILYEQPEFIRNLGYRIGGGGGLTLMMGQLNYGIKIVTQNSVFVQNRASFGSGAHLVLFSGTKNTAIEYINCNFSHNGVLRELLSNFSTVGGAGLGVFLDFGRPSNELSTPPHIVHNLNTSILIQSTLFFQNLAPYGAGLYFYSVHSSAVSDLTDVIYFYIHNSTFEQNAAYSGSAMQLWDTKFHAGLVGTQLEISDTNVSSNLILSVDLQSVQQNTGIIDIHQMNMTFKGNCNIEMNSGTGLRAEASHIGIHGIATFRKNTGVRGGAMFLITFTYLIVLPNASLHLLDNVARESGGAIYSNLLGLNSLISGGISDCFLYFSYDNIGACINCSDLNKTGSYIKFEGNSAPAGGQVFGSAFRSCPWAFDFLISQNKSVEDTRVLSLLAEKFPKVFSFDTPTAGPKYFKTQAQTLRAVGSNNSTEFNVLPGQEFNVTFVARDNFREIVSNVISSFVETTGSQFLSSGTSLIGRDNHGLLQDNEPTQLRMTVSGRENNNLSVVIYSNDLVGLARTEISVNLGQCGIGFMYNATSMTCVCNAELENLDITCITESLQLMKTRDDLWVGPVNDEGLLGAVSCPLLYCRDMAIIPVEEGEPDFDAQCDPQLFRRGVACGDCQEGRSIVLATSKCLECSNASILLFPFFLALGVVLVFVIYYVDMSVAIGLLNGAIFFSNLVTLYGTFLFPSGSSGAGFISIVSFLSLNFGIEACLYHGMSAIERLLWQLSFPFYLFILMIVIIVLARGRFLKRVQDHVSLTAARAFTTLLILCYVSILQVTSQLFGFIFIKTVEGGPEIRWTLQPSIRYFTGGNVFLLLGGIFLTFGYLVPFPLLLLFPSLIFKSKYLRKFKPLYDSFWHPFEPKFRFWLGFRLIFRWIPFLLTFLIAVPTNLFVTDLMLTILLFVQLTVKPFKSFWINVLDSLFICMLVMMFTGTLFFVANERQGDTASLEGATIYNEIFIVLAFFMILGIFVYHFIIRFPKLKAFGLRVLYCLSCKKSSKFAPPQQSSEKDVDKTIDMKERAAFPKKPSAPPTHSVVSTELREPLLEDGDFSIIVTPSARHTS